MKKSMKNGNQPRTEPMLFPELETPEYVLFFDTETTGIPKDYKAPPTDIDNWPRLVQLGWIVTNTSGDILKEGNQIVIPDGFEIPIEASNVHRITTDRARIEGEKINVILKDFMTDLQGVVRVVGHNLSFDLHVVGAELCRLGIGCRQLFSIPSLCTMQKTTNFCAIQGFYGYKWPKLQELYYKLFGKEFDEAHDAIADIRATKECYFELLRRKIID